MELKLNNKIDCPVKDLLSLIRQEDIEHLRKALLDVLEKSYPAGEFYLYEQGYSIYDAHEKKFSPTLIACRSKNKNCINKNQLMKLSSDDSAMSFDGFKYLPTENFVQVFTVESERSNRGLLITICEDVIDEHYVYTLLSAYNHQVHLLRNKETDSLTGLLNRQSFDSQLVKLHENFDLENRAGDEPCKFAFALLDIDFFKQVNDKFGHVYGDEVLLLFSNLMKKTFRDSDMLFRYGGEEFAVLLHHVDLELAETILNRFRENTEQFNYPMENKVTTSIGFCEFNNKIPLSSIIERADKALYYAKEHGRNKTFSFESLISQNKIQDTKINDGDIELF
ncbi:MAG: GGDEF domain-containing protein [Gammaproteobacteria bacterium]|nr:GGDEF domain-containing protein [Gammaproteobacteria bacterium]MCW8986885.1 GGDEF domain-containing protein [Gammaproteobacteria bacterium]